MKTTDTTSSRNSRWKKHLQGVVAVFLFGTVGYFVGSRVGQQDHSPRLVDTEASSGTGRTPLNSQADLDASGSLQVDQPTKAPALGQLKAASSPALLSPKGKPNGEPLRPADQNPDSEKGRVVKLDASKLRDWNTLREGDRVWLPGMDGESFEAVINLIQKEGDWFRMGGELADGKGTFSLSTDYAEVAGMILMPEVEVGFEITMDGGEALMVERRLSSLVCFPLNKQADPSLAARDSAARAATVTAQIAPLINTRPGAKGVVFVDFDGETVVDTAWNGGQVINAAPSTMTNDQITEIVSMAAQDWAPFDVTLTTDAALYAATAHGLRMHVVVTPTDTAAPGSGGVAYVNSWSNAGKGFSSGIVCWVFNQTVKSVAEAISHEVGHTVGLNHDGVSGGSDYYSGHGGSLSVPTSWGPIMGATYSKSLVQWSKGEYAGANNREDDLAIIGKTANQFGLVQSELSNGTKTLPVSGSAFQTEGLLRSSTSVDTYLFSTAGGQFSATARPSVVDSDVDVQLELQTAAGATLVLSDLSDALSAVINKTLSAGDYRLIVRPSGTGPVPVGGYTTGYSSYGSVGRYTLSGSILGVISLPSFTSPTWVQGTVGVPLAFTVGVSAGSTVSVTSSFLPTGLSFNPATLVLSGTPSQETIASAPGQLKLVATNASGSVTTTISIFVSKAGLPLSDAFLSKATVTSSFVPWTGVSIPKADGVVGTVAQSGAIGNGTSTSVSFNYVYQPTSRLGSTLWSQLTFYWKASTEVSQKFPSKGDSVQCRVDGVLRKDFDTGSQLILSGETGWVKQTLRVQGSGMHTVEFIYTKDASLSMGQDRVWVYLSSIGQPPEFSKFPASVRVAQGATSFTLSSEVSGATDLVWKKEFATLSNGISQSGSNISGATTATLTVTDITGADAGTYWLEARNPFGVRVSRVAEVFIGAPPVITQQPVAPTGLRLGDPMTLTATVSGGSPIFFRWEKDGSRPRWSTSSSSTISLVIPKTTAASVGKYTLSVSNQFGVVSSQPVLVNFTTAQSPSSPSR